jgi:hypothetical protein
MMGLVLTCKASNNGKTLVLQLLCGENQTVWLVAWTITQRDQNEAFIASHDPK